ncbi:uncharacterized protein LOC106884350 [Octopus bimaculoides]|uniref:uncharacterized protein LOC106884350 n=1 Tax=Octopus bimaculoides TaxID=37653 RepID=UPI00071DF1F9|nr:uncharacterized protein LOC106884350 [Octopus bimaculoides]|eukprot:XP_014791180.1 PREDICTED: uncharacterized protein LOC106884350 [Octopus bimaculoides]
MELTLLVKQMMDYVIEAQIIMGYGKDDTVFIPKIPLTPTDCPYRMQRLQFPLKLSFAMTINPSTSSIAESCRIGLSNIIPKVLAMPSRVRIMYCNILEFKDP